MKDPRLPEPIAREDGKLLCPMCGRVVRKTSDGAYYCTYEGWESFDPGPLGCLTCGGTPDLCAVCPLKQEPQPMTPEETQELLDRIARLERRVTRVERILTNVPG